jgi:hypothetical protein
MRKLAVSVTLLLAATAPTAAVRAAGGDCDRRCLYQVLDQYLAGMKARSPAQVPWAPQVRYTENNVALQVGDGLWGTTQALGSFQLRFADVQAGAIGFYGVVREGTTESPFALRLKVVAGKVSEAEAIVARPQDAGIPFVTVRAAADPVLYEMMPRSDPGFTPRERMVALANGYFDTLQRNDGHLHTEFDAHCQRFEDGMLTTNHPGVSYAPIMALGCADQFRLGYYRYDDRLRDRRFLVVDEERSLVMAAAFIDHSGRTADYTLTDGRTVSASIRRPNSLCVLETFKFHEGKIQHIEAVFTTVPYRMPSPWLTAGFHYE